MTATVTQLVVGPREHGVVQFGLALHAALQVRSRDAGLLWVPELDQAPQRLGVESRLVHAQFTDRLYGSDPGAAASAFTALSLAVRAGGGVLTATLHDLPQPSDGSHYRSRANAYRAVLAACRAVVVSSEHERELLRENVINGDNVHVIPLPIARAEECPAPVNTRPATIGVFGFIYPGKGHHDVVTAADGLPEDVEVHAIGAASAGHQDLVEDLRRAAARQNRTFRVTGLVDAGDLVPTLRAVTVPVAAHRHISASGSLNSWLTAGRRPLAPATRYTAEVERRNPGCLQLFPDTTTGLRGAIRNALHDPASTWLPADVTLHPSPSAAAAAYAEVFRVVRC